ncbi:hypothetical protein, conserved [Entamoeba dispar SAW760]|uniref:Uncharacterized protein n=1 Tax=Entamoeba dispar (strain ATCC PRA-260 / SAW760) TaxID=370354 RepID=B0EPG2_ENTDS|nr:uncharacterized protein EDI_197960 [Entamoeba dispar SAW760]EDR23570.1 hypothetical protein, conserved [Entamoeba dispar SAW760]|eukprot:EDR23570.1 hypothetical protein, conserved [Entamoeba dispar SAW760]
MDNTGHHKKEAPERVCVIDVDAGTEGSLRDFQSYENKSPKQPFRSCINYNSSSARRPYSFLKHHPHSQTQNSQMPQHLCFGERNNPSLFTNSSNNPQGYFPILQQNFHTKQNTLNECGFSTPSERHINEPFDRYSIHKSLNSLGVQHSIRNERNQPQMEQFHRSTQIPKYQKSFIPTRYCHSYHHHIPIVLNKLSQQKIPEQVLQNDLIQSKVHNPTHLHQQVNTLTPCSQEQIKISSNQQQNNYPLYQPISYTTPFSNLQNRTSKDYSIKQKQTDSIDLTSDVNSELPPIDNNEFYATDLPPLGVSHNILQQYSTPKTSQTQINPLINKKLEIQKKEDQSTLRTLSPLEKIINKPENKEQKRSNQLKSLSSLIEKSKQQAEQLLKNSNTTITQLKIQPNDNDKLLLVKSDIINSERNESKKPRDTIVEKEEKQNIVKKIIPIKPEIINNEISMGVQKKESHDKIEDKSNKIEKGLEVYNDDKNYLITFSNENVSNYFNFSIEEEGANDSTEETETFETNCTVEEDDYFNEKYESSYNELMKLLKKIHPIIKEKESRKFAEMIVSYLLRFGNDINTWNSGNEFNVFDKTSLQENVINSFIKERTLQVNIYTNVVLYRRITRAVKNIKINNFIIPIELQEFYLKSEWKFADDLRLMLQIAKYGIGVYELYLNDSLLDYSLTMKMHFSTIEEKRRFLASRVEDLLDSL